MVKDFIFVGLIFIFLLFFLAPKGETQSPLQMKDQEEKIRLEMLQISRELGVSCAECHNMNNLKDSSKKTFSMAKEHMRLVTVLRAEGMNGIKGPQATCYMCHRGELSPPSRLEK